jgi:DNA-binding PadR family transcriptional regulator
MIISIIPTGLVLVHQDPLAFLPLKPVELHVLLALVDGERHGYAIVREIEHQSAGVIDLEPGNLYRVLKRLLAGGLVEQSGQRPAPDLDDERRRYYRLSALGAKVAAAELRRLEDVVASGAARTLRQRWDSA